MLCGGAGDPCAHESAPRSGAPSERPIIASLIAGAWADLCVLRWAGMPTSYDGRMADAGKIESPTRRDPVVRRIIAAWRRLTGGSGVRDGGRRTLVACSGGADSSALLLALAAVKPGPEVCHVVHDLRDASVVRVEADRVRALCDALGVAYHEVEVKVAERAGNDEANARELRYAALARVAASRGLRYVATGHHADDQLETVLMRLVRGAGVRGLAGIRERRPILSTDTPSIDDERAVELVRPMLAITRDEACTLCQRAGWRWNEDATNADETRLRAALRARVLPALRSVEPSVAARVSRSTASLASADEAIEAAANSVVSQGEFCERVFRIRVDILVELPSAVLGRVILLVYHQIVGGSGADRISHAVLRSAIRGVLGGAESSGMHRIARMYLRKSAGWIEFCKKEDI